MIEENSKQGLGIVMAAIFLAGEMAGTGVLAFPYATIGTGRLDGLVNFLKKGYPNYPFNSLLQAGPVHS